MCYSHSPVSTLPYRSASNMLDISPVFGAYLTVATGTSLLHLVAFFYLSSHNASLTCIPLLNMAAHLSVLQREDEMEFEQYQECLSDWYWEQRRAIVIALLSHNLDEWGRAREARRLHFLEDREMRRSGVGVAIGERRRYSRRFTTRSCWVSYSLMKRTQLGEHMLLHDFRGDLRRFQVYVRMNPDQFDHLHELIRDDIAKENTNYRAASPTEEKLAAVLK